MSREWDRRAERQGGITIGLTRLRLIAIFVLSILVGGGWAWVIKTALACSGPATRGGWPEGKLTNINDLAYDSHSLGKGEVDSSILSGSTSVNA